MDLRKLQRVIVDALDDIKAQDIQVFNTTDQTDLFDRVIVATATSNRQTRALAAHVRDKVKAAGGHVIAVEGEDTGEWVLVDLGDAVVHIMQPAIRAYYRLEELWGAKPVSLKVGPDAKSAAKRKPAAVKRETAAASQTSPAPKTKRASTTPSTSNAASAPKATRTPKATSAAKATPVSSTSSSSTSTAAKPRAGKTAATTAAKPRASKTAAPAAAKKSGTRAARPAASPARKRTPSG
jgi:ribosome-associated protein